MTVKEQLIAKFKIDMPEYRSIGEHSFKHITIRLDGLLWCNQPMMECIFGKDDKIEDFASELSKNLKQMYPKDAPDDLGLSLDLISPTTILTGSFFHYDDGTVMHVAWTKRNNKWKPVMTGVSLENP